MTGRNCFFCMVHAGVRILQPVTVRRELPRLGKHGKDAAPCHFGCPYQLRKAQSRPSRKGLVVFSRTNLLRSLAKVISCIESVLLEGAESSLG